MLLHIIDLFDTKKYVILKYIIYLFHILQKYVILLIHHILTFITKNI